MYKVLKGELTSVVEALKYVKRSFTDWSSERLNGPFYEKCTKYKEQSKHTLLKLGWVEEMEGQKNSYRWTLPGMDITETVAMEFLECASEIVKEKNNQSIVNSTVKRDPPVNPRHPDMPENVNEKFTDESVSNLIKYSAKEAKNIPELHGTSNPEAETYYGKEGYAMIRSKLDCYTDSELKEELKRRGYHGKLIHEEEL